MKHLKYFVICLLGTLLLPGCYKDLGNYDYDEINRVQFSNFPTEKQYAFKNVDSIKVYPKVTGTLAKENLSDYFLKWEAVVKSGSVDGKTTFVLDSNTLNLNYFVRLPEAEYTVYLLVKDNTTQVTWRQGFDLKVTSTTNEGWLILSDVNGFSRLDMVSTSGKEEMMVRDIWADSPLALRKGPRKIAHYPDMNEYSSGAHPVYFVADGGTVKLDPDDFSYDPLNEFMYEFGKWDPDFVPTDLKGNYSNFWRFCVGKNGIYAKNDMTSGSIYGQPLNKIKGENDYFGVAPAIGMTALYYAYEPAGVFYDTTNLRFVQLTSDLQSMRLLTAEEKYFSFQTGRKFVYMTGTLHDNDGMIFAILRDNADKYWMYGMKAGSFSALSQDKDSYFQIEAPDIEKATAFAIHPTSYYLFYVVGNQIHQLDMTSRRHRVLPITFPDGKLKTELSGEKITMIKFNMFILGDASKPVGIKDMQSCLIVGSENETTSGELGGHVRMLSIPTSLDQPAEVYRSYEGFGKVVDVVYRERK